MMVLAWLQRHLGRKRALEMVLTGGRLKGELRAELDPSLCAAMLFGAVEMGLTSLVMGLLDGRDEALLGRAQLQLADSFLHGTLAEEASWKSGSRLKPAKRS